MSKKKGIPQEILDKLDISKKEPKALNEGRVIVESHQVKISVPNKIRQKMKLKESLKCVMEYDEINKRLTCQF